MVGGPLDDNRTSFLFASKQPGSDDDAKKKKEKKEKTKKLFELGKQIGMEEGKKKKQLEEESK